MGFIQQSSGSVPVEQIIHLFPSSPIHLNPNRPDLVLLPFHRK